AIKPRCKCQQHQTCNKGKRDHLNVAKPCYSAVDGCFGKTLDLYPAALQRKLYDKNSVFGKESHQHNSRYLEIDVVSHAKNIGKDKRAGQSYRERQNNRPGKNIAFVLGA